MKKNHIGTIESIEKVNEQVYSIVFSSSTMTDIQPGEYVSILCEGLTLRRPFSVADFSDGRVTVLFKKKGQGTEYISRLKVGDSIEFSAPLGNTFKIDNKKTLLIGAGIGVAPLFYLRKKLSEAGAQTYFAAGFLSKYDVLGERFSFNENLEFGKGESIFDGSVELSAKSSDTRLGEFDFVSTDDGTFGAKGSICDHLEQLIKDFAPQKIVSCAPTPVLRIVAQAAQKFGIESEVAMEKIMACGIGVCRGCVISVKKDGVVQNATICKDGPVFDGAEVVW